eukprot:gene6549-3200_t
MAALAGADSVTGVEAHGSLCRVARNNVALNGLSTQVSIIQGDVASIKPGKEINKQGSNLLVMDLFDEGLLGAGVLAAITNAKASVLQTGAEVVPAAATMYCMASMGNMSGQDDTGEGSTEEHYWGQALQYLECATPVESDQVVCVVAKRGGNPTVAQGLPPGVGVPVPKSPWKDEWGGGVSSENPHVQRAKYCELVVGEYMQRLPCGRFPSVDEEMKVAARVARPHLKEPSLEIEVTDLRN